MITPSSLFCDICGAANQPRASYCRTCGCPLQGTQPTVYNSATGRLLANVLLKQRYRIIVSAGRGGMGAVYRAEDTQLGNRKVAIKEMSQSGLSPHEVKEAATAFKQEAILLADLQHPNLPSIFDHFEEHGRWYLVMSFIEGETLEEYLNQAKAGKLSLDETLQIGIQLCTVLYYLHTRQPPIIFRDLKPSNIMRTASGHIYLIDFGIARHFKYGQAKDTIAYGSAGYAAPEQFGKKQTSPQSDIYSLGVTLHQLLSGSDPSQSPFRFAPLSSDNISTEFGTLIVQMVDMEEEKRPASTDEVKKQLERIAAQAKGSQLPPTQYADRSSLPSTQPAVNTPPHAPTQGVTLRSSSSGQLGPSQSSLMLNSSSGVPASSASERNKSSDQKQANVQLSTHQEPLSQSVRGGKSTKTQIWQLGRQQVISMFFGTFLSGVLFYLALNLQHAAYFSFSLFFVAVSAVLFCGIVFGPWVGLITGGVGLGISAWITLTTHNYSVPLWILFMGIALAGFIAGLVWLQTQGIYNTRRSCVLAEVYYVLGLVIANITLIVYVSSLGIYTPIIPPLCYGLIGAVPVLIVLPIFLTISSRSSKGSATVV